jgi:hypothetical protein
MKFLNITNKDDSFVRFDDFKVTKEGENIDSKRVLQLPIFRMTDQRKAIEES